MAEQKFDVIIIGGGPAGIAAALYVVRGGLNVAVIHNGESALHRAEYIENYYGVGRVSGAEMYESGIAQAHALGVKIIDGQVTFVQSDGESFSVYTPTGELYSRKLVIATGAARKKADVAGISDYEGKGVSYCAVCDAFFYRKKRVGVIGAGEFAEHEFSALKSVAGEVCLFTNGDTPCFSVQPVYTQKIVSVFGREDGRLGGVELDGGERVELDGLFVALGVMGSSAIAKSMGVFTDENGAIKVDGRGMTNISGLFAAGDCTHGLKQVSKAVADGMNVGLSVVSDLKRGV